MFVPPACGFRHGLQAARHLRQTHFQLAGALCGFGRPILAFPCREEQGSCDRQQQCHHQPGDNQHGLAERYGHRAHGQDDLVKFDHVRTLS